MIEQNGADRCTIAKNRPVTARTGRRAALWALAALVAAGGGALVRAMASATRPGKRRCGGHPLSLTLPDAAGQAQALAQWRGRILVVNFWATWCGPCVEEMPELSSLQSEHDPGQVQIIGIGVDSASNIAQFQAKSPVAYPLLVAGAGGIELSRNFGNEVGGLPFTVIIDARGDRGRPDGRASPPLRTARPDRRCTPDLSWRDAGCQMPGSA
jgi:thiol-disulfide isomerase/thioredoxin